MIYTRISRDRVGAGLGVDRQAKDCQELAERLGWAVVAERSDNDLSAYSGRARPGYEAMLDDIREERANAILAWHTDRLHRRPSELEAFISLCETYDVTVQTVRAGEVDLSTPSGRAIARTLGAWARHEVEHSIARQTRAKQQAAADGKYRGGRRPYGYEPDGVTVRPDEATVVRDITNRALLNESLNSIARDLNEAGLVHSTGGKWTARAVRDLVMRPRNAGFVEHHGEPEAAEAQWPAIVDRDTWRAARALMSDPNRRPIRRTPHRFIGSGVYVCGQCGDTMISATTMGAGRRNRPSYRCRAGYHVTRMAEPVDELVTEVALRRLSEADARILLQPSSDPTDTAELQDEANALRERLDEAGRMFAAGTIDGRQLTTITDSAQHRLDEINQHLAAGATGTALERFAGADDMRDAWATATVPERRAVIETLMTVTLVKAPRGRQPGGGYFDPDSVRIEWKTSG